MMVEFFEPTSGVDVLTKRMDVVVKHAAPALYNSLEYKRLPFRWALTPIANLKDSLRGKPGAIAAAVASGLVVLIFLMIVVQYPLRMDAKGRLLPKDRRYVYSRVTGPITKVKVTNLDRVTRDQEVAVIMDLDLLSKISSLIAQMDYARRQRDLYVEQSNRQGVSPEQRIQLENERIKSNFEFEKARGELEILLSQTRKPREASVVAPISGTVVSFDPTEKLEGRMVKPGDPLMQIADTEGPWEIVIKIPEAHVGHIRDALNKLKPGEFLWVDILLASHPDRTYKGKLYPSGLAGEAVVESNETSLEARVELDPDSFTREELNTMLVGAEAKIKVRCGNRPVGYVLFYELWEFFYERVVFWLF
jgi:biotin carboxyl carrier protein